MQNLIDLLTEKTQDLKEQFLIKVENSSKNYFNTTVTELANMSITAWYDRYAINYVQDIKTKYPTILKYNKEYYKIGTKRVQIFKIFQKGVDAYVAKELKKAQDHYTNSIIKLAARIIKKGITLDNDIEITYSRVDVNITITIIAKDITVRAFTIIASGSIQKEHYRFLVK